MSSIHEGGNNPPILHSSPANKEEAGLASIKLYDLIRHVISEYYSCEASVSKKICLDIVYHYDTDILRHMSHQTDGIDPAKHIAYLVFWLRKLKPISQAFYVEDVKNKTIDSDDMIAREIHDINERTSIALMEHLLLACSGRGILGYSDKNLQDKQSDLIEHYFEHYQKSHADLLHIRSDSFHSMIYDMRYRTFGPHHFTHIVNNVIYFINQKMSSD